MKEKFSPTELECLRLLWIALNGNKEEDFVSVDWSALYHLFCQHCIEALPADVISRLALPEDVRKSWGEQVIRQVFFCSSYRKVEARLFETLKFIPFCVLKGTAAAQYYPNQMYREMGDIDLMVPEDEFEKACDAMLASGWKDITQEQEAQFGRHRSYEYAGVRVELHRFFAVTGTEEQKKALDQLIIADIELGRPYLHDSENGLVLLSHIAQHLKAGIGLRQIVDWMMYVNKCMDDRVWEEDFREKAKAAGLDKLAVACTRMCQIYLGLRDNIRWCGEADDDLCAELMNYIMKCGNFGRSRSFMESGAVSALLEVPPLWKIREFFSYLQQRGEKSWKSKNKYPFLKSVAWLRQLLHYAKIVCREKISVRSIKEMYAEGKRRRRIFGLIGQK